MNGTMNKIKINKILDLNRFYQMNDTYQINCRYDINSTGKMKECGMKAHVRWITRVN